MAQEVQEQPVKNQLLARIQALDEAGLKKVVRTRARRVKVKTEFVGHTLAVFNGHDYTKVRITQEMVGRTLGKIAPRETPTARLRFVSVPPRKMRQVASMIQGLPAEKALNILNFTPKIAAHHMARTLKSAVANKLSLEGTAQLHPEDLHVRQVVVESAPTAKRIRFQSMGRVFRIRKRFCHLSIYLEERPEIEAVAKTSPAKAKGEEIATEDKKAKKKSGKGAKSKKPADGKGASGTKKSRAKDKGKSKVSAKRTSSEVTKAATAGQKGSQRGR